MFKLPVKISTLLVALLAILIAVNVFVFLNLVVNTLPYAYVYEKNNVLFVSNEGNPLDLLKTHGQSNLLLVSPEFSDQFPKGNSVLVNNSGLLFSTVAAANDLNSIFVVRNTEGEQHTLKNCQSNLGNNETAVDLTAEECTQLLNSTEPRVLITHPSAQYKRPLVIVSSQEIVLQPSRYEDMKGMSLVTAREMYVNADDIVRRTQLLGDFVFN